MALLSRVADRLYWGARYIERAEDAARVVRSFGEVLADHPRAGIRWGSLIAVAGEPTDPRTQTMTDEEQVVHYLVADREHDSSVAVAVERSRENLRTCREVMPREAWMVINDLSIYVRGAAPTSIGRRRRELMLSRVIDDSRRLDGVLAVTMTRDEAYEMWRLGRYIERADMTTRVIGVRAASLLALPAGAHEEFAEVQWMGVLRSLSALQMYQRSTRGAIDSGAVVRFLLFDHRFPRSIAGCLSEIRASVLRMPAHVSMLGTVEEADRALRRSHPAADDGAALGVAMDNVQSALVRLDAAMHEHYVA